MPTLLKVFVLACLLSACQSLPATSPESVTAENPTAKIVYEQGPCFGFCPVFTFEVNRDGHYVFEGKRHTQQPGRHEGVLMAEQTEKLFSLYQSVAALALPERIDSAHCQQYATDHSYLRLRYQNESSQWSLYHDLGCRQFEKRDALLELEREIQRVLPINRWVNPVDQ